MLGRWKSSSRITTESSSQTHHPGDLSLGILWELAILRTDPGRQKGCPRLCTSSVRNVYPVYQTRPQKSRWWFVDSQARQETCPWVVQTNKHPCLQGNDLESRWKLAPSLLKAIMEVTSSNWIWAQNILNTSEACFIELILALKMFCSIVIYIFVCLDSSLVC